MQQQEKPKAVKLNDVSRSGAILSAQPKEKPVYAYPPKVIRRKKP